MLSGCFENHLGAYYYYDRQKKLAFLFMIRLSHRVIMLTVHPTVREMVVDSSSLTLLGTSDVNISSVLES